MINRSLFYIIAIIILAAMYYAFYKNESYTPKTHAPVQTPAIQQEPPRIYSGDKG